MNNKINNKEIKNFSTKSYPTRVCSYLMSRKVPFQYNPETGIVFSATESFVSEMRRRLVNSYGCGKYPVFQTL